MRGNVIKLHQVGFRLDIRINFYTKMVIKAQKKLPREVVKLPSLSTFKSCLDMVLRDMR